jgi:peptide/nickel transport system ATP-binding protein
MHPYTEALLSASPSVDLTQPAQGIRLTGDIPSPRQKPAGCPFHTRCPRRLGPICAAEVPPLQIGEGGHQIRCHIPLADLRTLQSTPGGSG